MRLAILVTILAAVTACAAPQVSMPAGAACIAYANARADYAAAKVFAQQACLSGKLDAETCETLKQLDVRARVYRDTAEKALLDPTKPLDWQQVFSYSEELIQLFLTLSP